jgi:co-chaperonin GroES (HSP10)
MEENKEIQEQVIENVDNGTLAAVVASKVGYAFAKHIIIKPLDVQKVYKTLTVPEDSGEKDEDGEPIMQMTIKEIETESILRTGVIIALPASVRTNDNKIAGLELSIGDTIVFPKTRMMDFDLFKDTALVEPFDVLGKAV